MGDNRCGLSDENAVVEKYMQFIIQKVKEQNILDLSFNGRTEWRNNKGQHLYGRKLFPIFKSTDSKQILNNIPQGNKQLKLIL